MKYLCLNFFFLYIIRKFVEFLNINDATSKKIRKHACSFWNIQITIYYQKFVYISSKSFSRRTLFDLTMSEKFKFLVLTTKLLTSIRHFWCCRMLTFTIYRCFLGVFVSKYFYFDFTEKRCVKRNRDTKFSTRKL